jgi:hypothetical protein
MMNGAPVYIGDASQDARNSGVNFLGNNINSGDFVGNGIGANNGLGQLLWSTEQSWKLFTKQSPHSSYFCQGAWCNYNQQQKP